MQRHELVQGTLKDFTVIMSGNTVDRSVCAGHRRSTPSGRPRTQRPVLGRPLWGGQGRHAGPPSWWNVLTLRTGIGDVKGGVGFSFSTFSFPRP